MSKRNTKRRRRDPIRRPIPASRSPRPQPDRHHPGGQERLPTVGGEDMLGMLARVSVDVVPLYAVLAVMHREMSGEAANSCLSACYQSAAALGHLGFDIEPMAAYVEVDRGNKLVGTIGKREAPGLGSDWTTDGHCVLWAEPFRRLVDLTVVQLPALLRAVRHDDPGLRRPVVLPVDGGRERLLQEPLGVVRDPFLIVYQVQPQHTRVFEPWFDRFRDAMDYSGLAVAQEALRLITITGRHRNLRALPHQHPRLGALVSGRDQLPQLPEQPPRAWQELKDRSSAGHREAPDRARQSRRTP